MIELQEFKFNNIYELARLIDISVRCEIELWNYEEDFFIHSATSFSKDTLLHLYIVVTAMNHYHENFCENDFEGIDMQEWYFLFESYQIKVSKSNFNQSKLNIDEWFEKNSKKFAELFDKMADEVFYILFANRQFLLDFNSLIAKTVKGTNFPKNFTTQKGTIKRAAIPKWVKTAVYHREKGRCVFCNTDLTGLVNTLTNINYDHIIPLDLFGTNDPCNIQLTCEKCNKTKTNKDGKTSNKYIPWWNR
jgi:hypothetical protein